MTMTPPPLPPARKWMEAWRDKNLTTVDHNLIIMAHLLVNKELSDIGPLVTRQLNNLTELLIVIHGTVTLESLF
jgi:hypothetical protein